jgi:hypothetical protein
VNSSKKFKFCASEHFIKKFLKLCTSEQFIRKFLKLYASEEFIKKSREDITTISHPPTYGATATSGPYPHSRFAPVLAHPQLLSSSFVFLVSVRHPSGHLVYLLIFCCGIFP